MSPSEGSELLDIIVGGEAEVSELEAHVRVNKDVLKFNVSVDNTFAVDELELLDQLLSKESSHFFTHWSHLFDQIEKKWTFDEFHHNVGGVFESPVVILDDTIIGVFIELYDTLVVELG